MQVNIVKLSFLLSYLTLLICVVSGIPFMTAFFRSIILMVVFSFIGFFLRWFLLNTISSLEEKVLPKIGPMEEEAAAAGEEPVEKSMAENAGK
jgi:hypothetical protein